MACQCCNSTEQQRRTRPAQTSEFEQIQDSKLTLVALLLFGGPAVLTLLVVSHAALRDLAAAWRDCPLSRRRPLQASRLIFAPVPGACWRHWPAAGGLF